MRYAFVFDHSAEFPIALMCKVFGVSKSGYYDWKRRGTRSYRQLRRQRLLRLIEDSHSASNKSYGSPRVHRDLVALGEKVSKTFVAKLMRENGIRSKLKRKFKVTTNSKHKEVASPNLLKVGPLPTRRDRVYVADITYIQTGDGWLYLAGVMDLFSREIVGWQFSESLKSELCVDALDMAVKRRKTPPGAIFHSDQGVQYASKNFRQKLWSYGFLQSMSRRGCCWENATMESFWKTLKTEFVYDYKFSTREEARRRIFSWIEGDYHLRRRHSSLNYLTPANFGIDELLRVA